jgi:predicted lipoprotein with Yx(FWY)xxD motif
MTRSRPITFLASAAVIPLVALAVAACGGGGGAATAATPKTSSGASATVGVANSSLGSILVNSTGRTLYLFKADVGTKSACSGACATAWPPLLGSGKPTAAGAAAALPGDLSSLTSTRALADLINAAGRRTDALTQPADAAQEQSSAMTPTSQPSEPAGHGGAPDLIIWTTALSLLIISIVIPAAMGGGWLWLLTAVMVPLLAGWVTLQRLLITHNEHTQARGRGPLVAIVLCTAAAVTGFCAVVALAFQH